MCWKSFDEIEYNCERIIQNYSDDKNDEFVAENLVVSMSVHAEEKTFNQIFSEIWSSVRNIVPLSFLFQINLIRNCTSILKNL